MLGYDVHRRVAGVKMKIKIPLSIWLSGDFKLGHIYWNIPSVVPSKPDPSLRQNLLDILNDNNLTQVIDKPTRNDRTLDLLCMSNPSFINRIETLPPMGDHDIIFSEINLSLPKIKQKPHKVYQYQKANWEKIEQDLQTTHSHMKENQIHMDVNDLWNYFKNSTTDSIKKNIPTKSIGNKTTLPWVTPQIKKLINKKNKLFKKKTSNIELKYTKKLNQNSRKKCVILELH